MNSYKEFSFNDQTIAAKRIAELYHNGQKYGDKPYIRHLEAVVVCLNPNYFSDTRSFADSLAVAWLHDVLEDTNIDLKLLEYQLRPVVVMAIRLITLPPAPTRNIQFAMMYAAIESARISESETVRKAAQIASIVKICDRCCNITESMLNNPDKLERYIYEYDDFKTCFVDNGGGEAGKILNRLMQDASTM